LSPLPGPSENSNPGIHLPSLTFSSLAASRKLGGWGPGAQRKGTTFCGPLPICSQACRETEAQTTVCPPQGCCGLESAHLEFTTRADVRFQRSESLFLGPGCLSYPNDPLSHVHFPSHLCDCRVPRSCVTHLTLVLFLFYCFE
jgi:hypothetical protein